MEIDSCFFGCESHPICEDYAYHRKFSDDISISMISDGCSSGDRTDIGSRIMCVLIDKIIDEEFDNLKLISNDTQRVISFIVSKFLFKLDHFLKFFSTVENINSLLATSIINIKLKDNIIVIIMGDGYIVKKFNNAFAIHKYTYPKNTPFYPIYGCNILDMKTYVSQFNIQDKIKDEFTLCDLNFEKVLDYQVDEFNIKESTVISAITVEGEDKKELESIFVMSDGLGSFLEGNKKVSEFDILKEIFNFKTKKGKFLTRRMKSLLSELNEKGIKNMDDISISGIILK